jgi:putative transposase
LHLYLLDVYAQDWHDGVAAVPAQRWTQSVAAGWTPALHHDAGEVRILLGRSVVRTVQRTGIDHVCLRYQSAALDDLRHALSPPGAPVTVKYDPEDLGAIYVCDPTQDRRWLRVPAVDQGYARGLSLWKHRVIRAYVRHTMRQAVDVGALAAAKARIQEIVEQEFRRTRSSRQRRTAARFLGAGAGGAPALPVQAPTMPPPLPDAAAAESTVPVPDAGAGWGADYDLPHQVSRDPWR